MLCTALLVFSLISQTYHIPSYIIIIKNFTQFTAVCKTFPATTCANVTHIFSKQIRPLEHILHYNMFHLSHGFNCLANLCLNLSHKSNFCSLVFVLSLFGATSVIGHCVKLAPLLLLCC